VKRRVGLPKRTGWIKRSPVRKVNRARKVGEWARAYHSKAFVRFTKAAPCAACGRGPCDSAHTITGGMGRKGDWTTIIPLCSGINGCHAAQHRGGWASIGMTEEGRRRAAGYHRLAWADTRRGTDDDE
jgi:hypothetical protein